MLLYVYSTSYVYIFVKNVILFFFADEKCPAFINKMLTSPVHNTNMFTSYQQIRSKEDLSTFKSDSFYHARLGYHCL